MKILGIDPGQQGAISVIGEDGFEGVFPYTDRTLCIVCACYIGDCKAVVEEVHALPQNSVRSAFSFGKNYGIVLGILTAMHIPIETVTPQEWKKHYGITADKQTSIDKCKELIPGINLHRTERCKKESHDLAEAILIGLYGKEKDESDREDKKTP